MCDEEFYALLIITGVLIFIAVWVTAPAPVVKPEPWPWPTNKTHGKK